MEAKEFRVNNLVMFGESEIYPIKEVSENRFSIEIAPDCCASAYPPLSNGIKPIIITEEWLLKAEFIEQGYFLSSNTELYICLYKGEGYPNEGKALIIQNDIPLLTIDCKYVHQLQNLFFILKGEELTFNF